MMPPHGNMIRFDPQWYFRLLKRRTNVVYGHVEYDLSFDGIEDPDNIIIPMMSSVESVGGIKMQVLYISYLDEVYMCHFVCFNCNDSITVKVDSGTKPISTYDVFSTT